MKALSAKILGFALAGTLLGCSRQAVERQHHADGTFSFRCESELSACVSKVDDVCKGGPYIVYGGWDEPKMSGIEQNQIESHRSQVHFRCVPPGSLAKNVPGAPATVQPVPVETKKPATAVATSPAPTVSACVPGATQACVGPAACSGGQACLADASGFGPCDCGSR